MKKNRIQLKLNAFSICFFHKIGRVMKISIFLFLLGIFMIFSSSSYSRTTKLSKDIAENLLVQQEVSVKGTVTDAKGKGLPGVTIVVKGTVLGTATDKDGNYSLKVPADAKILVFSFVGMKTQEIEMNGRTVINVIMQPEAIGLEEVVAIGYGVQRKSDLTGAVTRINAEKLDKEATSNMTTMLRGAIPGLSVNLTRSAKGLSSPGDMMVRGQTSLRASESDTKAANAPLIVIDGMIYYGDLADINPQDIETFDVLKDGSSAAIYGARASNGVIIITTKKGKKGKPVINISTSTGLAVISPAHIERMNGAQHIAFRIAGFEENERKQITIGPGYYNNYNNLPAGVTLDQWKAYDGSTAATDLDNVWLSRIGFAPIEIANYEAGRTTDFKQYEYQTGLTQDYNISLSGSSDKISYYWSLGNTNNEGIRYNESFKNIRSRINLEANVTDWLKVGLNTQMAFRDESPIYSGTSSYLTPYSSMFEEDGKTINPTPSGYINALNIWMNLVYQTRFRKYNTLLSKIYGTLTLPFGFSFTSQFIPRFNWNREYDSYSSKHLVWALQGGMASRQNTIVFGWQVNNILHWNKTFGIHSFHVTMVQNAEKHQYWEDYMYRRQFQPSDVLGYHRMQAGTEDIEISSNDEYSTGDALLARLNYVLMSRYDLTASFRRDGYSAFGQEHPTADFGSVAAGWIISQENFYHIPWMNLLKLRFSYGTNGNRGVGIYDALSNLNTGKYVLYEGGTPYYVSQLYTSRMANPALKWERTASYNVGLDFSTFHDRLSGNIEGYFMITKDLLIPRQLPDITGFASVFSNMGQVNNKGVEFTLNSKNIDAEDFQWETNFSMSYNKNKIVHLFGDYVTDSLGNKKEVDDIDNGWFIGHAVDQIWDYKILGVWQEPEKDEAAKYSREPGDFKLWDRNGDGIYTNADKIFQGYRRPKFRLTLRNNFKYKNWELSVKMYSYLGYFSMNNHKRNNDTFYDRGTSYNVPYWTPSNPINDWARIESYETGFNVWENNSFVRLDNVALSYSIPKKLLNKVKIINCTVSLVAQNPLVWSPHWTWMDPEIHDYTPSYYSFKLNVTL